ncbi:MAG: GNAT family N-acetyltransferase [Methanobacteriota archaeon]|nr:MAG: GNAT family N-acetyltransferase [Euryarchaeota archaeon]
MASHLPSDGMMKAIDDFESMRTLALESGLDDGEFDGTVRAYGYFIGKELAGCVAMKRSRGTYSVEWLAVRAQDRGKGIGRLLVEKVAEDAREDGAGHLWAIARTPEFFMHMGFTSSSQEISPVLSFENCRRCPQFNNTCSPKIVTKAL